MTVIAGIKTKESVFLMGDRGASDGSSIVSLTPRNYGGKQKISFVDMREAGALGKWFNI